MEKSKNVLIFGLYANVILLLNSIL